MSSTPDSPASNFSTLDGAYDWLNSHINYEADLGAVSYSDDTFKLRPFHALLSRLGNPHQGVRSVHIAGTRGKGSTALFIEAVLRRAGLRVATFTSPHINEYRERIRIDAAPISGDIFCQSLREVAEAAGQNDAPAEDSSFKTVFELLTATFFVAARISEADFLVVETGLGGRLDTTNALDAGPVLLTKIGLEHTHLLGDTIEAIASEKAAILKPGGWGVFCQQEDEAATAVFRERVKLTKAPLVEASALCPITRERHHEDGTEIEIGWKGSQLHFDLPLFGSFVGENLQGALALLAEIFRKGEVEEISGAAVVDAISRVEMPGKMQRVVAANPAKTEIFIDAGHCPTAARAIAGTMGGHFPEGQAVLVVHMMADKDHAEFFREIVVWGGWEALILYDSNLLRSASSDILRVSARPYFARIETCSNLPTALELALDMAEESTRVVCTGSIYAVAPTLNWISTTYAEPPAAAQNRASIKPKPGPRDSGT